MNFPKEIPHENFGSDHRYILERKFLIDGSRVKDWRVFKMQKPTQSARLAQLY
jgi:hypothetical protein